MKNKYIVGGCIVGIISLLLIGCNKKIDLGGWSQVMASTEHDFTTSKEGAYFIQDNILSFWDYDSQKAVPLCSKSGCVHKDESCNAYMNCEYIRYNNDTLYSVEEDYDAGVKYVAKRAKDGTGFQKICTPAKDEIDGGNYISIDENIWTEDYLWYGVIVDDGSQTQIDDQYVEVYQHEKIYCCNLETGKEELIIDNEKEGQLRLIAANNGKLVYEECEYKDAVIPISEAAGITYDKDTKNVIHQYDLETSEDMIIFEFSGDEKLRVLGVASDHIVTYDTEGNLCLFNIENGEKEILYSSQTDWAGMFTDSMIILKNTDKNEILFYDLENREEIKSNLDLEKEFITFCSCWEDSFFINRYNEKIDEKLYAGKKKAFVTRDNLEKGEEKYIDLYQ